MRILLGLLLAIGCSSQKHNVRSEMVPARSEASVPGELETRQPASAPPNPKLQPSEASGHGEKLACQETASSAAEFVSRMLCEYRTIDTYQDSGTITVRDLDANKTTEIAFLTSFVRPKRFRYEVTFRSLRALPGQRFTDTKTVWQKGGEIFEHATWEGEIQNAGEMPIALAGMTVWARGAESFVPSLLTTNSGAGWRIDSFELMSIDTVDGVKCHRIQTPSMEIWIGKSDFLLHRVVFSMRKSIRVDILFDRVEKDQPIAESTFDYDGPPAQ